MSAVDLPGDSGGTYTWGTTSRKIRLANTTGTSVAIEALTTPGDARDSETITVTRTGRDGSEKTKTVSLTVAKVTFLPAVTQHYGYDDLDTSINANDDHICIMSDGETFVAVKIEGGALGSDFSFECDAIAVGIADQPAATAEFDLRLRAKRHQKKSTVLRAKVNCPSSAVFASLNVHVYTEKLVSIVVAKVADNASAATTLNFGTAEYAAHQDTANSKLKDAVTKFEIRNFDPENNITNIAFDRDSTGALTYDINGGGGPGFDMIKKTVTKSRNDQYRVVIIRNMRSYYYLDRRAKKGDISISVRGTNIWPSSRPMPLGSGATLETVQVTTNTGNIGTLAFPLQYDHAVGEAWEYPGAAWASDPILIMEGNASLDMTKWTILHEVGHRALNLADVQDVKNFMHFDQSNTDYRLRYCPRDRKYKPGQENQWEEIPRPVLKRPKTI